MHIEFECKKILLYGEAVDFRKAVDGLCAIVVEELKEAPGDGLYIFYNKARNRLKILGWHGNGFVLLYKRLEKGRFMPNTSKTLPNEKLILNTQQLNWLLAGLDWKLLSDWDKCNFKDFI
jgi:transposase